MAQQINPQTVTVLRSMKKTAIIVLLLFNLSGPVTAKHVAELLDIDYQTCRKYLKELSLLNVVSETPVGWVLLQGGPQLILPPSAIFEPDNAIIAPTPESSSAACPTPFHLQEEEEVEEVLKARFSRVDQRVDQCLQTLTDYGITATPRVLEILRDERITPEYIASQAERLEKEKRWSTGLLLTVMKCYDPVPTIKRKHKEKGIDGQDYLSGFKKYGIEY